MSRKLAVDELKEMIREEMLSEFSSFKPREVYELSSGTIASIAGTSSYEAIDDIKDRWYTWVRKQPTEYETWMDAWSAFTKAIGIKMDKKGRVIDTKSLLKKLGIQEAKMGITEGMISTILNRRCAMSRKLTIGELKEMIREELSTMMKEGKREIKYTHYTNFGLNSQPRLADRDGYLKYREDFEELPESKWTAVERFIAELEGSISKWRGGK